jgi:hypothetical protein
MNGTEKKSGTKRKLDEYFDDESINDESIDTEISNAWEAINDSQDAEEVEDDDNLIIAFDNEEQPLKKTKKNTHDSVLKVPQTAPTDEVKNSQQAVYKKLNDTKLSKFMEDTIGKSELQSVYSTHFDDFNDDNSEDDNSEDDNLKQESHESDNTVFSFHTGHESIKSKDEYTGLKKRTDGQIVRQEITVTEVNIGKLKVNFSNIIEKYKKEGTLSTSTNIELSELEEDYSNVFGNLGIMFYKYKKEKSNLHNAFFPTLLGQHVDLDQHTFNRIYQKQMVLDLCLFVYNLDLFKQINKPYTFIRYHFIETDEKGNIKEDDESTAFSITSKKSTRDAIKEIKGCEKICKDEHKDLTGTEITCDEEEYVCSQLTDDGSDDDSRPGGGKRSKSNQGGKKGSNKGSIKGPTKGSNKGPKKNHKTNKKRTNRSFMMKSKKSKPRKTQRKKNSKKKTQRKKLIVKKDIQKKTKRVRFAV